MHKDIDMETNAEQKQKEWDTNKQEAQEKLQVQTTMEMVGRKKKKHWRMQNWNLKAIIQNGKNNAQQN